MILVGATLAILLRMLVGCGVVATGEVVGKIGGTAAVGEHVGCNYLLKPSNVILMPHFQNPYCMSRSSPHFSIKELHPLGCTFLHFDHHLTRRILRIVFLNWPYMPLLSPSSSRSNQGP